MTEKSGGMIPRKLTLDYLHSGLDWSYGHCSSCSSFLYENTSLIIKYINYKRSNMINKKIALNYDENAFESKKTNPSPVIASAFSKAAILGIAIACAIAISFTSPPNPNPANTTTKS